MPTRNASRDSVIILTISSISRSRGVNPRVSKSSIYLISVLSFNLKRRLLLAYNFLKILVEGPLVVVYARETRSEV